MARYTVSEGRRRFFELLDTAARGEEVILERRGGLRFRLILDTLGERKPETVESPLIVDDPEVLAGQWTWVTDADGQLAFQSLPSDASAP
jgi:hypothetical protein